MKTGLVILNYNDKASVIKLVESVKKYNVLEHIVIVDNHSTDDSYEYLGSRYNGNQKISVLKTEKNAGYAYGNNYGAEYLIQNYDIDIIVISNPDVLFKEELLIDIADKFEKNPQYAVLTGVMKRPDGSIDKMPYRDFFSYWHDLGDNFICVRRLVYEKRENKIDFTKEIMNVKVIQGSFFAITSKAYRDIDGLDENTFLYYEEMILGKRLEKAGYLTGIITNRSFIHDHSVSIKKSIKAVKMWQVMLKSKYYYQQKYNHANAFKMLILRLLGYFSTLEKLIIEVFRLL